MAGFKLQNWRGDQLTEDVRQGVGRALFKAASHLLNESTNIAPKDEGTLIQTAGVDVDMDEGKASVYYTQKYAVRLHEHPEYNFQGGRQGKYLEKVVMSEGTKVGEILAEDLKDVFK